VQIPWRDIQSAVEAACPWPSHEALLLQTWGPPGKPALPDAVGHFPQKHGVHHCTHCAEHLVPNGDLHATLAEKYLASDDSTRPQWALMLCDCAMVHGQRWLDSSDADSSIVGQLQRLLEIRKRFMSEVHPRMWEHMLLLAMALQKADEMNRAEQLAKDCVAIQKAVLCESSLHLLYCMQYASYLGFKLGNMQPGLLTIKQGYARLRASNVDDMCIRAVVARNLLCVGDYAAVVKCMLPVFQQEFIAETPLSSQFFGSCMHMLIMGLLQQQMLEECEAVSLALLLQQTHAPDLTHFKALRSQRQLMVLAMHDFKLYTLSLWNTLAMIYHQAGLLQEAAAAAGKSNLESDYECLSTAGHVLCDMGDLQVGSARTSSVVANM
jgi:hypothetical protein